MLYGDVTQILLFFFFFVVGLYVSVNVIIGI